MSPDPNVVGWDIGGAHLKLACFTADGMLCKVIEKPTPIWQGLDTLQRAIDDIEQQVSLKGCTHYLTMTAELADLFDDRAQGVVEIVDLVRQRFPGALIRVFAGQQGFVDARDVGGQVVAIASANWMATAKFVAACVPDALLVDIGSTTTDLVLCRHGDLDCRGYSDKARLASGELVYSGVVRTPLMAVVTEIPFAGDWLATANEHFATLADAYRIIGALPQDVDLHPTADGRDKSVSSSMRRLARMVGCDLADGSTAAWTEAAHFVVERHTDSLLKALRRQLSRNPQADYPLVGAGAGQFLVERLAGLTGRAYIPIQDLPGLDPSDDKISVCAPAVAVGKLGMMEPMACAC
ncbi:hydantoinase/oxoprolinase family protein [Thiosocius teredinicola]|uniref:hydantoinase/oxoprolinase family protein n=1 Tax=Thiosocius teredinicola TaxID=1973002 RepID=UPI0013DE3371